MDVTSALDEVVGWNIERKRMKSEGRGTHRKRCDIFADRYPLFWFFIIVILADLQRRVFLLCPTSCFIGNWPALHSFDFNPAVLINVNVYVAFIFNFSIVFLGQNVQFIS